MMNINNNSNIFGGALGKYGRYSLPILFLLGCGSSSKIPTISLFDTCDTCEIYELNSELTTENKNIQNGTMRKSIAYPDRDIHELYPYVEEISLETDSLKNK